MKLTRLISAGAALTFAALASAGSLNVGDQAPDLGKDVSWIKGDSVTEFQEGNIYVLDFWATWCAPCVRAIPHMDELAEKHEADGVTVIGVAVWPNDSMTPTVEYVKGRGDDMSYTVAADIDGAVAQRFMTATGSNGIPTVMIVDREGVLAWIGHPMAGMDEALGQIIAGTYDIEGAAAEGRRKAAAAAKTKPMMDKANAAFMSGDFEGALIAIEELIKLDPEQFAGFRIQVFGIILEKIKDEPRAYAYAKEMIEGPWAEDSQALNAIAWIITDSDSVEHPDLDLAYKAISKANKLTQGEDPMILDTLAAVFYNMGKIDKAIATQRKAISKADADFVEQLKPALDKYLAAASEG